MIMPVRGHPAAGTAFPEGATKRNSTSPTPYCIWSTIATDLVDDMTDEPSV